MKRAQKWADWTCHATKEGEVMDNFGNGGFIWAVFFHSPCRTGDYRWVAEHYLSFESW